MRYGANVIAVPTQYHPEFRRDPQGAMLHFGSQPQRARMPYFSDATAITDAMVLPDQVCGPRSRAVDLTDPPSRCLVADRDVRSLMDGLADTFMAPVADESFWHVHVDGALNTDGSGDRAGFAMGRIAHIEVERGEDILEQRYERVVRTFEIPLAAQIAAPPGSQIQLGSILRMILLLRQERGFNITSWSTDGFESAMAMQEMAWAGIATAGMRVEDNGEVTGIPKAFSVDKTPLPYREALMALNERRLSLPRYGILLRELRTLERVPGKAPDHSEGGSKDVADGIAGCIGYLAVHGHTELPTTAPVLTREDFEQMHGWDEPLTFGPPQADWTDDLGLEQEDATVQFGVE